MSKQVIIKFKTANPGPSSDIKKWLNEIAGGTSFSDVHPLFPGETDEEMASLYVAQTDTTNLTQLLALLNRHSGIDYAHVPIERRG